MCLISSEFFAHNAPFAGAKINAEYVAQDDGGYGFSKVLVNDVDVTEKLTVDDEYSLGRELDDLFAEDAEDAALDAALRDRGDD